MQNTFNKIENLIEEEFGHDFLVNHTAGYGDSDGEEISIDTTVGSVIIAWNTDNFEGFYLSVYNHNEGEDHYQMTRKTLKGVRTYIQKHVE